MRVRDSKGIISIFILWAVFISVLIAIGVGYRATLELKSASYHRDRVVARNLIWNGLNQAFKILEKDSESNGVDCLNDNWCLPFDYQSRDGICHVQIMDEDRKVNINFASDALLKQVFNTEFANSIIDWRDEDEESFLDYPSRNGPLKSLYELRYVKGGENLKPEEMDEIKRTFTVYGDDKLNINTVNQEVFDIVMTAYNLDNIKNDLWRIREGGDYFESLSPHYIAQLVYRKNFDDLDKDIQNSIQKLNNFFKVSSDYFRIYLVATTNRDIKKEVAVVVKRENGFNILNWKENFWTQ